MGSCLFGMWSAVALLGSPVCLVLLDFVLVTCFWCFRLNCFLPLFVSCVCLFVISLGLNCFIY